MKYNDKRTSYTVTPKQMIVLVSLLIDSGFEPPEFSTVSHYFEPYKKHYKKTLKDLIQSEEIDIEISEEKKEISFLKNNSSCGGSPPPPPPPKNKKSLRDKIREGEIYIKPEKPLKPNNKFLLSKSNFYIKNLKKNNRLNSKNHQPIISQSFKEWATQYKKNCNINSQTEEANGTLFMNNLKHFYRINEKNGKEASKDKKLNISECKNDNNLETNFNFKNIDSKYAAVMHGMGMNLELLEKVDKLCKPDNDDREEQILYESNLDNQIQDNAEVINEKMPWFSHVINSKTDEEEVVIEQKNYLRDKIYQDCHQRFKEISDFQYNSISDKIKTKNQEYQDFIKEQQNKTNKISNLLEAQKSITFTPLPQVDNSLKAIRDNFLKKPLDNFISVTDDTQTLNFTDFTTQKRFDFEEISQINKYSDIEKHYNILRPQQRKKTNFGESICSYDYKACLNLNCSEYKKGRNILRGSVAWCQACQGSLSDIII